MAEAPCPKFAAFSHRSRPVGTNGMMLLLLTRLVKDVLVLGSAIAQRASTGFQRLSHGQPQRR